MDKTSNRALHYINLYYDEHRVTPTIEQVAKSIGKTKATAQYHINKLLKAEKLEKRLDGRAYPMQGYGHTPVEAKD